MHTTPASLLLRLREPSDAASWERFVQLYTRLFFYWARRIGLQESVRRVTVRVFWDESGRPNQTLEVVTFLTDPAKLVLVPQSELVS